MTTGGSTRWKRPATIAAFATVFAVYLLRLDRVIGLQVDDAWYVLLARALAEGRGYELISAPTPGLMPFYPPGFPFLLSLIYRVAPDFPSNVPLLKSLSILSALGAGAIACRYFTRVRGAPWYFALMLSAAATLAPPLVFLSTGMLMSEPVFLLVQMTSVVLVEYGLHNEGTGRVARPILFAGLVAGFTMLVRTAGIGVIIGGLIYLLLKRRRRAAWTFALGAAALVAPWMIYAQINAPTPEQQSRHNGYIVRSYMEQFWHRSAGSPHLGSIGVEGLPGRVWSNAVRMTTRDAGELSAARLYYFLEDAGGGAAALSLALSVLIIIGYVASWRRGPTMAEVFIAPTLAIILLWPWDTLRFLVVLLPFGLFYLLTGAGIVYGFLMRRRESSPDWRGLTFAAGLIVALNLYANFLYIVRGLASAPDERPTLVRAFEENEEMLLWMREELPEDAVVASTNPALVFLYTGRRAIYSEDPAGNWERWNGLGVRYMALISATRIPDPIAEERKYPIIYHSRGALNLRVLDLGEPERREPWSRERGTREK